MSKQHHGTVCKTCRKRGKKCDKLLPECSTCVGKGIQCEGYTFRWSGVASRGKLAGKRIPVADSTPNADQSENPIPTTRAAKSNRVVKQSKATIIWSTEQELFTTAESEEIVDIPRDGGAVGGNLSLESGSDLNDLEFEYQVLEDRDILQMDFNTMPKISSMGLMPFTNPSSADLQTYRSFTKPLDPFNVPLDIKHVLDYYLAVVSPRMSVDNNSSRNPYTRYILPLAIETPSLLYACAALAACQFNIRLGDEEYYMKALRFKGKAMKRLQESLYSGERAKDQGTLATILMLSLCDISLGGSARFDAHFLGAKKLIDLRESQRTPGNFVEQYIIWLDTMAATSHSRKPAFSANEIAEWTASSKSTETKTWSFDVFPCPVEHFEIIHEVVLLYKSQMDPNHPTLEVLMKVKRCKKRVLDLPMQLERGEYWLHLTEAYRFAIVLYLMRLFHLGHDVDEIAWLASSVFHHAKSTPPSTGWADQMLWPLFHAALEIRDDARKSWLRERSKEMQHSGGFRNVGSAMEILERVWAGTSPRNYMQLVSGDDIDCLLFV